MQVVRATGALSDQTGVGIAGAARNGPAVAQICDLAQSAITATMLAAAFPGETEHDFGEMLDAGAQSYRARAGS
jgi:hypothetical protein